MIMLNRKAGTSLHSDQQEHCFDHECPCNTIVHDDPRDREFMDVLHAIEEDDEDFSSGLGEGYMHWYDQRIPPALSELTCSSLYQFMTERENEQSARWNAGFLAGFFIAMGEGRPDFKWESAEPPSR